VAPYPRGAHGRAYGLTRDRLVVSGVLEGREAGAAAALRECMPRKVRPESGISVAAFARRHPCRRAAGTPARR
jgi:hypothetical protein